MNFFCLSELLLLFTPSLTVAQCACLYVKVVSVVSNSTLLHGLCAYTTYQISISVRPIVSGNPAGYWSNAVDLTVTTTESGKDIRVE